jgi:hypothetical protein
LQSAWNLPGNLVSSIDLPESTASDRNLAGVSRPFTTRQLLACRIYPIRQMLSQLFRNSTMRFNAPVATDGFVARAIPFELRKGFEKARCALSKQRISNAS